jgi:hypothetical protein
VSTNVPASAIVSAIRSESFAAIVRDQHRSFHPPKVTELPIKPPDGYEVYFEYDTAGAYGGPVIWHLRYDGSGRTYPWLAVGAQVPLFAEVVDEHSTASGAYADLGTSIGPEVSVPLAGVYDVEIGAISWSDTGGKAFIMSYTIGSTGASDDDGLICQEPTQATVILRPSMRARRKTLPANTLLRAKYRAVSGDHTATWRHRWMRVTPVRVG